MKNIFNFKKNKNNKDELVRVNADFNIGLNDAEVIERKNRGFVNKEKIKVSASFLVLILKNIFTFFNILLIIIGVILIIFEQYTSCVFLVILFMNVSIGLFQDIRAKIASNKLSLIEKVKVKVIRNSKEIEVYSEEIVLDDIIHLKNDEKIPCDGVVIKGEANVNESLLTGESTPLHKLNNLKVYGGSYVMSGDIYVRVLKVGEENYISKLQIRSKEFKQTRSKMYVMLNKLFKVIGVVVILLGFLSIIEFGIAGLMNENLTLENLYDWLKGGVIRQLSGSLVSIIPSGMYLLTSTALAVGVFNLVKEKVLVKDMYSQETLARVNTLCIDKTGTITDGNMSVFDYKLFDKGLKKDRFEAYIASYCVVLGQDNITSKTLSDYFNKKEIFDVKEYVHFSSTYKYSAINFKEGGTLVIGAYNYFELENANEIKSFVEESSLSGFRVLVVGFSNEDIKKEKLPKKIRAIAVIRLQDHIREDVKESIKRFNENDVNVKVISGDNPMTVSKIAEATGILNASNYISLENCTDEEVKEAALKYNVFGRVSPDQKDLIVKTLKENKKTVAMVGDGINDILSLKSADVSIALESGSKATKDIASLVLVDNDFTKLPEVIYQGRRVINNLSRTCTLFLTKTVFAIAINLFFLLYGMLTTFGTKDAILWPFSPNNFYCWELVTIGVSSFLLTLENNKTRIKGNFLLKAIKTALPYGIKLAIPISLLYIFYLVYDFGLDGTQVLDIATLFISLASFIPLIYVTLPFNLYRGSVLGLSVILCITLYVWSIFGTNWLLINGPSAAAPRSLSTTVIVITIILLGIFLILVFAPKTIKQIIKLTKERKGNKQNEANGK